MSVFALAAHGQIFSNSFVQGAGEAPGLSDPPGPGFVTQVGRPTVPFTFANGAWNVVSGNVDWIGEYWQDATQAFFGGNVDSRRSLELNGFGCTPADPGCAGQTYSGVGRIESVGTFNLTAGQVYSVTFYMAGNPDPAGGGLTKGTPSLRVGFEDNAGANEIYTGNYSWTFAGGGSHTRDNMGWQAVQWTFTATANAVGARLFFQSTTTFPSDFRNESWGAVVDEVRFGEVVIPEPGTYALMGAGLALVAFLRRR